MSQLTAILLFVGNVLLFWLWANHLLPLLRELMRSERGKCPRCGN